MKSQNNVLPLLDDKANESHNNIFHVPLHHQIKPQVTLTSQNLFHMHFPNQKA
jgi:hypothetical protein